jgi:hypothetical protein
MNVDVYPRTIGYFRIPTLAMDAPDTTLHRIKDALGPTQLRSLCKQLNELHHAIRFPSFSSSSTVLDAVVLLL